MMTFDGLNNWSNIYDRLRSASINQIGIHLRHLKSRFDLRIFSN